MRSYRNQLRETNEANFLRFEAALGQRLAELKTELVKWMFAFWVPTALGIIGTALLLRK